MTDRPGSGEEGGEYADGPSRPAHPGYGPPPAYGEGPGQPPAYGAPPPAYGAPPPAYGGQPPTYPGQRHYGQPPPYGQGHPPAYGSPDPNSYLGAPAYPGPAHDGGYGGPPASGTSVPAIVAFVLAIVVPLVGLLAVVPLAIVALVKIGKTGQRGKGLAIASLVISVLWWVGFIALGVFVGGEADRADDGTIVEAGRIEFGDVRVGDCVDIDGLEDSQAEVDVFDLEGVPCGDAHNAEAAGLVEISADSYPGDQAVNTQSANACPGIVAEYLDRDLAGWQLYRLQPNAGLYDDGDENHRVICFVTKPDFSRSTGSAQDN